MVRGRSALSTSQMNPEGDVVVSLHMLLLLEKVLPYIIRWFGNYEGVFNLEIGDGSAGVLILVRQLPT